MPSVRDHTEVIICDGVSHDNSVEIASCFPCQIVHSDAGRATQMNFASKIARGQFLLFLHADSNLPEDFDDHIRAGTKWGFFRLRLIAKAIPFRIIESTINLRTRLTRIAGGDQGLYFDRQFFESLEAYPQIPLMEDIAICKTARRLARPNIIDSPISSSGRRWQSRGIVKTILLMWTLRLAYWLGVDPGKLHRIYYP